MRRFNQHDTKERQTIGESDSGIFVVDTPIGSRVDPSPLPARPAMFGVLPIIYHSQHVRGVVMQRSLAVAELPS